MERNIDKIKMLEHELGRYQKKVADQGKENAELRERLKNTANGIVQTNQALVATLAQAALTYGEEAKDTDAGEAIERRLVLPWFDLLNVLARYEVWARKDEVAQQYIIGVVPRDLPKSDAGECEAEIARTK